MKTKYMVLGLGGSLPGCLADNGCQFFDIKIRWRVFGTDNKNEFKGKTDYGFRKKRIDKES